MRAVGRLVNPFYSPITFSITGEDHRVVEEALSPLRGETVLCIASAGDTPLNLLRLDPGRVDAVDISFPQLCLSALKATAMRRLDLADFKILLGVVRDPSRALKCYDAVRPDLGADVRNFWDRHRYIVRRGVLWQGGIQRLIGLAPRALRLAFGREGVEALARVANREQAEAFSRNYVATQRFLCLFRLVVNRWTYRLFYPKSGFRHLPPGMSPSEFSLIKVRDIIRNRPLANNPYLFPLIFGRYPSDECVPPYLSPADYDVIGARAGRLKFVHHDLRDYLRTLAGDSVGAFALCNAVDWMSDSDVTDLLLQVIRVAKADARVLLFSRGRSSRVPLPLRAHLVGNPALGEALATVDRTGYYPSTGVFRVRK